MRLENWCLSSLRLFLALRCATSFTLDGVSQNSQKNSSTLRKCSVLGSKENVEALEEGASVDLLFLERFRRRKSEIDSLVRDEVQRRPPNVDLSPQETVSEVSQGLRRPHHPQRSFGLVTLLHASTLEWRQVLFASVGAPLEEDRETVAAALETTMRRPNNQFLILLGLEDDGYWIDFPTDPVDYGDGSCWLECRLRSKDTQELLVANGWSLQRDSVTQAWMIEGLDWKDFRDPYRPGIGREEWERICG